MNPARSRLPRRLLLAALTLAPLPALAHPGHGGLAAGFAHPFAGLDHLAAMLAVGLVAATVARGARWMLPAGFVAAALLGALLGFAGLRLPGLEPVIALSVAALGALLACRATPACPLYRTPVFRAPDALARPALLVALVAPWGLFHGNAHALEASGHPALFVSGFLAGTALLHAIGLTAGVRVGAWVARATGAGLMVLGAWLSWSALASS